MGCPGMYKCPRSYCISTIRLCDGRSDCLEGEDERDCPQNKAPLCPGFYKCYSGECLAMQYVCNNHRHCPLGDDELLCEKQTLHVDNRMC